MNTFPPPSSASHFKPLWLMSSIVVVMVVVGAGIWLKAQSRQITGTFDAVNADPAYIVVSTSTPVTFTSVISDSSLRRHDPLKVLLVRTDAAGNPIDIVGRMVDNGRRDDATRRDHTYTIRVTLNEATVGPIYFKVAARFNDAPRFTRDSDDWDRDFTSLNDARNRSRRPTQLALLLRKLQRYELSEVILVDIWQLTSGDALGFTVGAPSRYVTATRIDTSARKIGFYLDQESANEGSGTLFAVSAEPLVPSGTLREFIESRGGRMDSVQEVVIGGRQFLRWNEDLGDGLSATAYTTWFSAAEVVTVTTMSSSFATSSELIGVLQSLSF